MKTVEYFAIYDDGVDGRNRTVAALVANNGTLVDEVASIIGDGWGHPASHAKQTLVIAESLMEISHPAVKEHVQRVARAADPAAWKQYQDLKKRFGDA